MNTLKSQAYLVTHTVHVAYEAMHLDERNALQSFPPIYLLSFASYWQKRLVRLEFAGELKAEVRRATVSAAACWATPPNRPVATRSPTGGHTMAYSRQQAPAPMESLASAYVRLTSRSAALTNNGVFTKDNWCPRFYHILQKWVLLCKDAHAGLVVMVTYAASAGAWGGGWRLCYRP